MEILVRNNDIYMLVCETIMKAVSTTGLSILKGHKTLVERVGQKRDECEEDTAPSYNILVT